MSNWKTKMCPELTKAAFMAKEVVRLTVDKPRVVSAGLEQPPREPEPEAVACQGESCMWFLPIVDESGKVIGGDCAIARNPIAGNQQAMATLELVKTASALLSKLAHVGGAIQKS